MIGRKKRKKFYLSEEGKIVAKGVLKLYPELAQVKGEKDRSKKA